MWLLFLFLAVVVYLAWLKRVEGMSPTADEMNEEHAGKIIKIDNQLKAFAVSQADVDELERIVDLNVENTSALQANLGQQNPNGRPNAYP